MPSDLTTTPTSREMAEQAAKIVRERHRSHFAALAPAANEGHLWQSSKDREHVMARYILSQSQPTESQCRSFDLTFFLRNVLSQGGAIQQDYADKPYEEYARRLDCAAVERAAELSAGIAGTQPTGGNDGN